MLTSLKHVLYPKPSKGDGKSLISNGECQQELKEDKDEFALIGKIKSTMSHFQ